jgi:regulator of protease activity HflC (stomatin/prohibitin superfamily)
MITETIKDSKGDPASYLLALKYIEALKEMVTGKDNKVVYVPYEASGILGSIGLIKEMFNRSGK